MLKTGAEIIFGLVAVGAALLSLAMIYTLLRFGRSKILGIIVSALYLVIMTSLYAAASANFDKIPFPKL